MTEEESIKNALVFSCAKCKTILGDSYSFVSSNEEMKTITLASASNIQRTAELYTSYSTHDEGSTYFCFSCTDCSNLLGRYYVTTSRDLDDLREKFTFGIDSITSYELGTSQHGKLPDATEQTNSNNNTKEQSETEYELLKIQHVMLDLVQRVTFLEGKLAQLSQNPQSVQTNNGAGKNDLGPNRANKRLKDR